MMGTRQDILETRAWLQRRPSLDKLQERFPQEWTVVRDELLAAAERGEHGVVAYVTELAAPTVASTKGSAGSERERLARDVRRMMVEIALKELSFSAATGVKKGKVRFNLLNGWVAQRLLFRRALVRKPVSLFWYRIVWPLLWQRRLLMPLVQPKGIYCFYSAKLVHELAELVGDRRCLEIAAGDGTLAGFLRDAGVDVVATDDGSWSRAIDYPATVLRQDARTALRAHKPEVVVCSWPPAGNPFERDVFHTASVQTYIVINSGKEYGSGNRTDYLRQTGFDCIADRRLGQLVLPRELGCVVHVFQRRS